MKKQTLKAYFRTVNWLGNDIIDWNSGGMCYSLDGTKKQD